MDTDKLRLKILQAEMMNLLGGTTAKIIEVDTEALSGNISLDALYNLNNLGLSRGKWFKLYHHVVNRAMVRDMTRMIGDEE